MAQSNGLPKTIEGATNRYLHTYESNFQGPTCEMKRLKKIAEANILILRRKAPNFYENHLPTLVNQAASAILSCETHTADGSRKFHETHRNFLKVLDELKKSQPEESVNFQNEVQRVREKDVLMQKQLFIRNKINELEATEIECDEVGSEEAETKYNKIFGELDKLKIELKKISKMIAKLEGEELDFCAEFKLEIPDGSSLERLGACQQKNLESQIVEFLKQNKNKKKSMFVDKSIIDGMIAKLNISHLAQVEMNDLSKDALDAYKQFFRKIENERREEFYDSLLDNQYLKPKEGIILADPDDVPDDIKQRLDQSNRRYKRKMDECFEEFAKRQPENLDENASADVIEDEDESSNDGVEFLKIVEDNGHLFKRVKEEPRDDYENEAPSDDEAIVPSTAADDIEGLHNGHPINNGNASSNYSTPQHQSSSSSPEPQASGSLAIASGSHHNAHNGNRSQDEFEVLGIVPPMDKIPVINIDDD